MKRLLSVLVVFCGCIVSGCNGQPEADFTIRVKDDDGVPVTNAIVGAGYTTREKNIEVRGATDAQGVYRYHGKFGADNGWFLEKAGYYCTDNMEINFTNVISGRLQPWGIQIEATLRPIVKPIGMYASCMTQPSPKIPELGKPFGFDLMKSDWVAPFGKGEVADFIFQLESAGEGFHMNETLTLTFSNPDDGIQCFISDPRRGGSVFRSPRYAPETGYATNFISMFRFMGEEHRNDKRENQNYIFRVRTKRDDHGVITNAFYGKIYGPIGYSTPFVGCTYYLNPTSLNRNLEFDRTKNLLKGVVDDRQLPSKP